MNVTKKVIGTIVVRRGPAGPAGEPGDIAQEIESATALTPIAGTEKVALSISGVLKSLTLANLKTWVLNGLTIAWGSVTGKPETFPPVAHQHVSADITDASTGGNLSDDAGKLAKFDAEGSLVGNTVSGSTFFLSAEDCDNVARQTFAGSGSYTVFEAKASGNNALTDRTDGTPDNLIPADAATGAAILAALGGGSLVVADFDYATATAGLGITGANGAWAITIPDNAKSIDLIMVSAGCGGGSGRRGAAGSARYGGGGGSGGAVALLTLPCSKLPSLSLTVEVPAGGAGGASASADNTDGADGVAGAGAYVRSGGIYVAACTGSYNGYGKKGTASSGAGGVQNTSAATFLAIAGGSSSVSGVAGAGSYGTFKEPLGGCAGGGISAANAWYRGGTTLADYLGGIYGSIGTIAFANTYVEGASPDASTQTAWSPIGPPGSGGNASAAGAGGKGGDGLRGGGGGGGGASVNGYSSGAGGKGGDGFVRMIIRF